MEVYIAGQLAELKWESSSKPRLIAGEKHGSQVWLPETKKG